jgi:hypothetical protein
MPAKGRRALFLPSYCAKQGIFAQIALDKKRGVRYNTNRMASGMQSVCAGVRV